MDSALSELIDAASARGSKYLKGQAGMTELPEKMAELGVLLLERSRRLPYLEDDQARQELNEVQNKLDDLRKAIFSNKISPR